MSIVIAARGAQGDVVRRIQTGLEALSFPPGLIDGDFGPKTQTAVTGFQAAGRLPASGEVDVVTWRELLATDPPPQRDRCLQLTASFEGHGFTLAQGNFDGAGLTWGIIGFTLKFGGVQQIVLGVHRQFPELIPWAFGDRRTAKLLQMMGAPRSQAIKWADSISLGSSKARLQKPWREGFAALGAMPEVQAAQYRLAEEEYFTPAIATARDQRLATALGLALCFDIHVQNGGIKHRTKEKIAAELDDNPVSTEQERRVIIANAVADSASLRWRENVRIRKVAIATGAGRVHGRMYVLRNWGLTECPF